jgi:hypothetical protein
LIPSVERRTEKRISLEAFGHLLKEGESWDCYIQNISLGGALVLTNLSLVSAEPLVFDFSFKEKFEIPCIVVHSKEIEESRRRIIQIAKGLDLLYSVNLKFNERISFEKFQMSLGNPL